MLLLHEFQSWHGKAFVLKRSLHNALFQSVSKLFVAATFAFAKDISYTINQIWFVSFILGRLDWSIGLAMDLGFGSRSILLVLSAFLRTRERVIHKYDVNCKL